MATGAQTLLCEIFSCGSSDLELLDDIGYSWDEVLDQMDWPREGLDFNDLLRAIVDLGIIGVKEAVTSRIETLEGMASRDDDEEQELKVLRELRPDDDIRASFNFRDNHVWFERNGSAYRYYLEDAVDEFEENTGFYISGGELSSRQFTAEQVEHIMERTGLSREECDRILREWDRGQADVDDIIDEWEDAPGY